MVLFSPLNVARVKAKGNIKIFLKILGARRQWSSASEAALAFGKVGGANAIEPLIAARLNESHAFALSAWHALICPAARGMGQDLGTRLHETSVTNLCPQGLPSTLRRIHYDGDDVEFNRAEVQEVQRGICGQRIKELCVRRCAMAARAPGLLPDPVVVKPLVMRLRTHGNGTWDMQPCRAAVGFLRQICDPCAAEPIQQCLKDWFPRVHEQTGLTLGTLGVALLADGALQAAI